MAESQPRLIDREVNWYALGSLPGGVSALGIPGSWIGLGAAAVSLFDALTDPVVGAISDRSRGRWGRRSS